MQNAREKLIGLSITISYLNAIYCIQKEYPELNKIHDNLLKEGKQVLDKYLGYAESKTIDHDHIFKTLSPYVSDLNGLIYFSEEGMEVIEYAHANNLLHLFGDTVVLGTTHDLLTSMLFPLYSFDVNREHWTFDDFKILYDVHVPTHATYLFNNTHLVKGCFMFEQKSSDVWIVNHDEVDKYIVKIKTCLSHFIKNHERLFNHQLKWDNCFKPVFETIEKFDHEVRVIKETYWKLKDVVLSFDLEYPKANEIDDVNDPIINSHKEALSHD